MLLLDLKTAPLPAAGPPATRDTGPGAKILRFYRSERLLHWAIAIPFLVCFATAMVLVVYYNPDPHRSYRAFFSWTHRLSGACLIVLPILAVYRSQGNIAVHFYNIKQAWTWVWDDFRWLGLMFAAALNSKIELPDQGKFNAAEKINFMVLLGTYPLYVATGLLIWLTDCAFVSWLLHSMMAVLAAPLVLGHLYMALISPHGQPGLSGMVSGFVDRHWAKHHYGHWYRERYGRRDSEG